MENAEMTSPEGRPDDVPDQTRDESAVASAGSPQRSDARPLHVEPDFEFIRTMRRHGGDTFLKCFQCGTCSGTCALAPGPEPFPRKEMAWAVWGLKEPLLADPDIWLCHNCGDCSTNCPRGARPGDVLAAARLMSVERYAFPGFLARWLRDPRYIPILLGIPVLLLGMLLRLRDPLAEALDMTHRSEGLIVYPYSSVFPHWLLNGFFFGMALLVGVAAVVGLVRFWRALGTSLPPEAERAPGRSLGASIVAVVRGILTHDQFDLCTRERARHLAHLTVFFGFLAVGLVTLWILVAKWIPPFADGFLYPFAFWSPWKLMANLGGLGLAVGCLLMIRDRLGDIEYAGASSYFHWSLLGTLALVVLTGFATELLHYMRMEPHRHAIYFLHLVFVFVLLVYLPYTKLAHILYRTTALVFAEYHGRRGPSADDGGADQGGGS